jgi:YD repeat-containing protein
VIGATQPGLAVSFTYDGFGRQLTQTSPVGPVRSAWNAGGRRTRITYPDNHHVDQDHLVTGELTVIRENGATAGSGVLATYGYDRLGRRISMTRGNGTSTAYGYDAAGRLHLLSRDLAGSRTI